MADKGRFSQPPSAQDDPQRGRIGRVPSRFRTHEARPAEVAERLSRDRVSPSSTGTGHEKSPSPTYPPATQEAASQPPHGYRPTYGRAHRTQPTVQDARAREEAENRARLAEEAKDRKAKDLAAGVDPYAHVRVPHGVRGAVDIAGMEKGVQGLRLTSEEDLLTRPAKYDKCKTGSEGQACTVVSNYVEITAPWDKFVALFDVKFSPDEPVRKLRVEFVQKLMKEVDIVAPAYVYNGRNLAFVQISAARYMAQKAKSVTFMREGVPGGVTCTATFARNITNESGEINQFLNNMKNYWLETLLKLAMLGRCHYDPSAVIKILEGNIRLLLWPGFSTSIADYDGGKLFNVDNRFKVIREQTVAQVIQDAFRNAQRNRATPAQAQHTATEEVIGTICITQYSDKPRHYRITGVDWTKNVDTYSFEKDGKQITLRDYFYTKYNRTIKDANQPLLLAEESGAARFKVPGQERALYLVPELASPTGLTDEMRANFRLMKAMADHTLQPPEQRTLKIYDFMVKLLSNSEVSKYTTTWAMKFAQDLLPVKARIMKPVGLQQGMKKFSYSANRADWGTDLRSGKFHVPFHNADGILFAYPRDAQRVADAFLGELKIVGKPMGWNPPEPMRYEYDSDRNLLNDVRTRCESARNITLVIVMLQSKLKGRYDELKTLLCRDLPVISQCVVRKTLENSKNLKTVATKIAMQMGSKLGGAPWALDANRFSHHGNIMYVGVDTFHDSGAKGGSRAAVAVVGTLDTLSTEYCSRVFFQAARQEIGDMLGNSVGHLMDQYKNSGKLNRYPDVLVFYRDGVGAGQLESVLKNEVAAVRRAIETRNAGTQMAFVVVTKRHSTRFVVDAGKVMENPMPGTVVDTGVTKPNRMDFYIVAQSVRQGTVAPTYYSVIFDNTLLTVDQLQQLTYAQSCMYFNWTGPVKVPAQCQYAHKLAFLVGQSIHDTPAKEMDNFLYYL